MKYPLDLQEITIHYACSYVILVEIFFCATMDLQIHNDSVNEKLTNQNFTYIPMESNNFEYLYHVTQPYLPDRVEK